MHEYESRYRADERLRRRLWIALWVAAIASYAAFTAAMIGPSFGHEAMSIKGDPLGWIWPKECCNSAATAVNGDCAVIDASTVREGPDGYIVTLKVGDHPQLKTKGYTAVIPYSAARNSPSGEYGICLGVDGSHRFCFFAGAKSY